MFYHLFYFCAAIYPIELSGGMTGALFPLTDLADPQAFIHPFLWPCSVYSTGGIFFEACLSTPPGTLHPDSACYYEGTWQTGECEPGTDCLEPDLICTEWCQYPSDCDDLSADCEYGLEIGFVDYGVPGYYIEIPAPYGICVRP